MAPALSVFHAHHPLTGFGVWHGHSLLPPAQFRLLLWALQAHDLLVGFSTDTAVDDGVKNLLAAWKACQDWKDYGQAHNGRLIGRNGEPQSVLKKSERGPKKSPVVPTGVMTNSFEPA